MALIKCKECNGEVSDKAHICPHCGIVVNAAESEIGKWRIGRLNRGRMCWLITLALSIPFICLDKHNRINAIYVFILAFIGVIVSSMMIDNIRKPTENAEDNNQDQMTE